MTHIRKKMKIEEVKKEESADSINYLGILPNELKYHLLTSSLSYEDMDNLKLAEKNYKPACDYFLRQAYLKAKEEVKIRSENAGFILNNNTIYLETSTWLAHYTSQIFWFVVNEFLNNSFCLFDICKGYSDAEYYVNGKTLDIVNRILQLKDTDEPLSHLVELVIGRSHRHSNMKSFDNFTHYYYDWFVIKKCSRKKPESIYLPVFNKKQPGLNLPHFLAPVKKQCFAMTLDILSSLWTQKNFLDKHRVSPFPKYVNVNFCGNSLIPVFKPGQNKDPQMYEDSDDDTTDSDPDSDPDDFDSEELNSDSEDFE